MKGQSVALVGATRFDPSGKRLVSHEPDAISIVEVATGTTTRLAIEDVRAIAAFDDQLWITTSDDRLQRLDYKGRAIGASCALPFAAGAILEAVPCGPPAVIWRSTPHVAIVDDFGQLKLVELPEADAIVPFTGRRYLVAKGSTVTLPTGVGVALGGGAVAHGGLVLADGKYAVLVVTVAGTRQLVLVALGTGQIVQRYHAASAVIRVAAKRGIALVQVEARAIAATDLVSGRDLGRLTIDRDVADFAIDADGRRVALVDAHGDIEIVELATLIERPSARAIAAAPAAGTEARPTGADAAGTELGAEASLVPVGRASAPAAVDETFVANAAEYATSVAPVAVVPVGVLAALEPRERTVGVAREVARAQLQTELRGVALRTLLAIAHAWDTRRIGYGNEGKHPFELEVGAILGVSNGFATEHVAAARERLAIYELAASADETLRAPATPVGSLAAELALSPIAVDIILVIAAAALWGEAARLYGILANDASRAAVDELLVQQILESRYDRADIAAELDQRAPLVRFGIVAIGKRARPFAELTIDAVVLDRLRGIEIELGNATSVRASTCSLGELDIPRDVLVAACTALASPAANRIAVRGKRGCGRRTLLASLAAEAGRDIAVIDALALPRDRDAFATELARALRRCQLAGHVPAIANLDEVTLGELSACDVASEPLRLHPGPIAVVLAREASAPFAAGHVAIEIPVLDETARRGVWQRALVAADVSTDDLDLLASRFKIGPGTIRRAVAAARGAAEVRVAIEGYIRQTRDARLAQYARRVDRLASWTSVVLPPDILDSLRELVARVRHGRQVFDTWGMSKMMATSRGLTALFQGPPGTGKTLVAGVIANELGLDLYQVDLSKVTSKWIGETERNLSTIFDAAEDGQVVLLFDEADSLFAKRTEVRSSNDRYANLEVNYLLQRLDTFEGIAILTTNSGTSIDQAFKRRMSFRLSFPFPDEETREQLWRAHLPPELPIAGTLVLDGLARKYQISGGYIRNACLRAAFLAAQDETALHQRHLERAVTLEYAELGKLSNSGAID